MAAPLGTPLGRRRHRRLSAAQGAVPSHSRCQGTTMVSRRRHRSLLAAGAPHCQGGQLLAVELRCQGRWQARHPNWWGASRWRCRRTTFHLRHNILRLPCKCRRRHGCLPGTSHPTSAVCTRTATHRSGQERCSQEEGGGSGLLHQQVGSSLRKPCSCSRSTMSSCRWTNPLPNSSNQRHSHKVEMSLPDNPSLCSRSTTPSCRRTNQLPNSSNQLRNHRA
mmetsp:Transcript_3393/g.7755  ORF Transcript_3393/g.7755 Transcript_3393/m.7755 type:complete len:221 (+) Transcript_3393:58-720(+)